MSTLPLYDSNNEHTNCIIGMKFNNVEQFREAIRRYVMTKGHPVRFKRNEVGMVKVMYKKGCK